MTINKNSVEQINVALLDMDKKLKSAISKSASASDFNNLEASVDNIKRTLNETKTGLEPGKTYNINISGNAATADKAKEAEKAGKLVNALTINGETYDGSEAVDAGVQKIENGGTGVTTQADINKAFIGNLEIGESDVTDGTEFVSSWASDNGFAETTEGALNKPYKRQFIKVWNYIKSKISSVLGLTKDNYGGNAATADKATNARFLDEYVGAGGTRLTSGNIVPKDSSEYGGMRKDVVTSSMTDSGRPGYDGHLLTMFWDSNRRWDSQFFVSNETPLTVKARFKDNTADYGPWTDIITSNNIGSQTVASAGNAGTADSLFYRHGNEINFKGGAPNACYFNWRNADTGDPSPVDTMQYVFCNYSNDTSKSVIKAGSFDGNKLTIQGVTVGSNSYTDTNPKIEFKNVDGSQSISLTFTDFDAVQAPASLTLNGNQGNEYFIAPCIKANNKMVIPIGEPSSLEDGCIWIER